MRGRTSANWRRLAAQVRAQRLDCCICGQAIDYTLHYNDPGAFTVAHRISVAQRPDLAEEPSNIKGAAHRGCNSSEGADRQLTPLGITSGL